MNDQTDFSMLYRELGIEPEAGIDAFQRAYRRSLKRLHPDTGAMHVGMETVDLSWLVRDYRRALAFHDVHGRLPGVRDRELSPSTRTDLRSMPNHDASTQPDLSGINPFSRWIQVLVIVTMVVIGMGLLLH